MRKLTVTLTIAAVPAVVLGCTLLRPAPEPEPPPMKEMTGDVASLVAQLYRPENKVIWLSTHIPGGESLVLSPPMKALIRLGADARQPLHECLGDRHIQNEVVLILGAIGDRSTVPLLIEAYPDGRIARDEVTGPDRLRVVCFSFALSYLTGQSIGRSREGADFNPSNRELWRAWWETYGPSFLVPATKPNASWVPHYPAD